MVASGSGVVAAHKNAPYKKAGTVRSAAVCSVRRDGGQTPLGSHGAARYNHALRTAVDAMRSVMKRNGGQAIPGSGVAARTAPHNKTKVNAETVRPMVKNLLDAKVERKKYLSTND